MIHLKNFISFLKKRQISFFTGVPDSILKQLSIYINKNKIKHIPATSEGSAVALATGYYLSQNKIPAIYLQNSGLSNAINPLISICHKKVYSIPSLLIIGWRGSPGSNDEPQHQTKGIITPDLLRLLGIKFCVLEEKKDLTKLSKLITIAKKNKLTVACLLKKNTFYKTKITKLKNNKSDNFIKRENFIRQLLKSIDNKTKIVSTTGYISRELFKQSSNVQKKNNFYVVGGMGHCSMIAFGYSLFSKKNVICLDGDGSLLMHMGSLFTIGQNAKNNFKYILLNNNSHESVGGQVTNLAEINLQKISKELKFSGYLKVNNEKELKKKINHFLNSKKINFLEIRMSKFNNNSSLGRPKNFLEIKKSFMK